MLFTTPFCKFCPTVKEYISTVQIKGAYIDASKEEGNEKAIRFKVNKVPTVIFLDDSGKELTRAHNISEIREILAEE